MSEVSDERLLAQLQGLFREELQDNVRLLVDGVARLATEKRGDERGALVQELFRAAHSLKGAAHAAGMADAVGPCHRLEDLLAELRAGRRELDGSVVSSLADDVDALAALENRLSLAAAGPAPGPVGGSHPPPAEAAPVDAGGPPVEPRARVAVGALEELLTQAGGLLAAGQRLRLLTEALLEASDPRARLGSRRSGAAAHDVELLERVAIEAGAIERELGGAAERVAHSALHLRMQPFSEVTAGLDHVVRDLGRSTGKPARMVLEGADVQLDREIATSLREPLLHLLRNAIRHGIEAPDRRSRTGKGSVGTVTVSASPTGSRVRIAVADDGAGIDVDALRAAAGDVEVAADDAVELAFRPGLSTTGAVDEVSGRGIGLDAVRARIESLGGTVQLHPGGEGTSTGAEVVLDVPVSLAALRILLVAVGDELVAIPAESVRRLERIAAERLQLVDGQLLVVDDERARRAVSLATALDVAGPAGHADHLTVVEVAGESGVLVVDRAVVEQEGLLQRLPDRAASPMVIGAVQLPFDRVALVVNPSTCLRAAPHAAGPDPASRASRQRSAILLVEDTATTRLLEHSILAGAGYDVIDASDGTEAWRLLGDHHVDLVVSDVDLPTMSGIELCRAIRSSSRLGHLPVVLVTSLGSDEDRRRGVDSGADAYLVKSSFDQVALLDAVRRLL